MNQSYNCSSSEMLLSLKIISESFMKNIDELSQYRTNWTREYAQKLMEKFDYGIDNYIEMDSRKQLRDATAHLVSIQVPALKDLSAFMIQVKVDFPDEAGNILRQLGYNKNYDLATKNNSQNALIQLLKGFKKGMTTRLRKKIESQGVKPELIDRLIDYAGSLLDANTEQERLKETSKKVTESAHKYMIDIYREVIGICKIAKGVFQNDPILKNQFTFSKVVRNMSSGQSNNSKSLNSNPEPKIKSSDVT